MFQSDIKTTAAAKNAKTNKIPLEKANMVKNSGNTDHICMEQAMYKYKINSTDDPRGKMCDCNEEQQSKNPNF